MKEKKLNEFLLLKIVSEKTTITRYNNKYIGKNQNN